MPYIVRADSLGRIRLGVTDPVQSILQNVAVLLNVWKGECPMYRDFGLSPEILHRPVNVVKTMLRADIIAAVEKYEPRAIVTDVAFDVDAERPDRMNLVLTIKLEDEEEDEDVS